MPPPSRLAHVDVFSAKCFIYRCDTLTHTHIGKVNEPHWISYAQVLVFFLHWSKPESRDRRHKVILALIKKKNSGECDIVHRYTAPVLVLSVTKFDVCGKCASDSHEKLYIHESIEQRVRRAFDKVAYFVCAQNETIATRWTSERAHTHTHTYDLSAHVKSKTEKNAHTIWIMSRKCVLSKSRDEIEMNGTGELTLADANIARWILWMKKERKKSESTQVHKLFTAPMLAKCMRPRSLSPPLMPTGTQNVLATQSPV